MTRENEYSALHKAIDDFKAAVNNFGIRFINDEQARVKYNQLAKQMSEEILFEVRSGKLTPLQGAEKAQITRNIIMEQIRTMTSDWGRSFAQSLKKEGKSFAELEEKYSLERYKKPFQSLAESERGMVWLDIVKSSSRANPKWTKMSRMLGRAGRGFVVATIAVSVYNVTTADDKATAAAHEGASLGAGFLGGAAGGAIAGMACGPGAPVCSGIGVFVGGVIGALGGEALFDFFK